jgi:hypothetical protein
MCWQVYLPTISIYPGCTLVPPSTLLHTNPCNSQENCPVAVPCPCHLLHLPASHHILGIKGSVRTSRPGCGRSSTSLIPCPLFYLRLETLHRIFGHSFHENMVLTCHCRNNVQQIVDTFESTSDQSSHFVIVLYRPQTLSLTIFPPRLPHVLPQLGRLLHSITCFCF